MILTLLYGLFIVVVCIQIGYFIGFTSYFPKQTHSPNDALLIGVSVIIAAKNEFKNLSAFLPSILAQNYPTFEVIVINDASKDKSLALLHEFQQQYDNLHIISLEASESYQGNKKNALAKGIEKAQYETVLFTDADCYPNSNQWLALMVHPLDLEKEIVLGFGGYEKEPSFLNKLIRFETTLTALQYFSYAQFGLPYMGVGRNLAIKKSTLGNAPYITHQNIRSGDDDLLINEKATATNTAVMLAGDSFTYSPAKRSLTAWIKQKRRHYTTASSYKTVHQLMLGLFFSSQFLFWGLAIILIALAFKWQLVILLVILRLGFQVLSFNRAANKLNARDLIPFLPILDVALVAIQLYCGIINLISKPKNW